jgi:hypothetical protein
MTVFFSKPYSIFIFITIKILREFRFVNIESDTKDHS